MFDILGHLLIPQLLRLQIGFASHYKTPVSLAATDAILCFHGICSSLRALYLTEPFFPHPLEICCFLRNRFVSVALFGFWF